MKNQINISGNIQNQQELFNENNPCIAKANKDFENYINKISTLLPILSCTYELNNEMTFIINKNILTAGDLNVLMVHGYPFHIAYSKLETDFLGFKITIRKTI